MVVVTSFPSPNCFPSLSNTIVFTKPDGATSAEMHNVPVIAVTGLVVSDCTGEMCGIARVIARPDRTGFSTQRRRDSENGDGNGVA